MSEQPVPAPRTKILPTKATWDVCKSDTPEVPYKKPPPVLPKHHKIIKLGGQPLPGMAPISPTWDSEKVQEGNQSEKNLDMMRSLTLQPATEAPESIFDHGSDSRLEQMKPLAKRTPMLPQRSLDGGFREPVSHPALYQRSISLVTTGYGDFNEETEVYENYVEWWDSEEAKHGFKCDAPETKSEEAEAFTKTARCVRAALRVYGYLLTDRGAKLKSLITELKDVASNLDKVFKGTKIAGITGGAAGAVGVAAAVGGVILAPLTMGASLVVAAAGVGVAAAGTVTGASAAITNKVSSSSDRKKVERILKDYNAHMEEIQRCVTYIDTGVEQLRKYDLSELDSMDKESVKIAKVAQVAGDNTKAIQAISMSSGVIQGFALGMDIYFSEEDSQKLKKGSETKFASQIRKVAKHMEASLEEMMKFKTVLESSDMQAII